MITVINHAAVAFASFLLILLKSGPTDDETFLPFSGSLWNCFLIFKAEKTARSLGFRGARRSAYHVSRRVNKRHDHFQKMSSTYHVVCYAGGRSEAAPGCESSSVVGPEDEEEVEEKEEGGEAFSHSHFIPPARFYQHVGLLRLFIWSCMMKEQLSKFAADRKALSVWLREGNPDAHFTHCDSAGCKGNVATRTANLATLSKNNNNKKQKKLIPYAAFFFHYDYLPIVLHISLLYALRAHTTCQRWCCWSEQRGKKPPLF